MQVVANGSCFSRWLRLKSDLAVGVDRIAIDPICGQLEFEIAAVNLLDDPDLVARGSTDGGSVVIPVNTCGIAYAVRVRGPKGAKARVSVLASPEARPKTDSPESAFARLFKATRPPPCLRRPSSARRSGRSFGGSEAASAKLRQAWQRPRAKRRA